METDSLKEILASELKISGNLSKFERIFKNKVAIESMAKNSSVSTAAMASAIISVIDESDDPDLYIAAQSLISEGGK